MLIFSPKSVSCTNKYAVKSQKYVLSNQDLKATVTKMAIQVYLQFQKTNILPNHYINVRLCE